MGQKTNPIGLRVGVYRPWSSRWFAARDYKVLLTEDQTIKDYIRKRLEHAGINRVDIFRAPKRITVDIHTARPGVVIGRKGAEVEKLKHEIEYFSGKEIQLNIIEVRKPEVEAQLIADSIARQLEGRVSHRRAMKRALQSGMKLGAEGIRIMVKGRIGGAEIARREQYLEGRVPLHTLRANIDFAHSTANTTYGTIGVKVWVCRGEYTSRDFSVGEEPRESSEQRARDGRRRQPGRDRGRSRRGGRSRG
jgi:small subunit ribosomal protein S3